MRCSWVEKNGSRNKIDWECTKNDVSGVVSLFGGNLVHTSMSGGRSGFGGVDLLVGACPDHCCCLRHGVEHSDSGAGSGDTRGSSVLPDHTCNRLQRQCVELGCSVELGWWTRRHIGWHRWVVLAKHT